ncbi:hypothetical protein ABIE85_001419 [Bradyrhizobium diazoefficiens]
MTRFSRCHRPRRRAIQYAETVVIESTGRGVLDSPLSRGMTEVGGAAPFNTARRHPTRWFADPCTIRPASFTRRYSQIFLPRSFA